MKGSATPEFQMSEGEGKCLVFGTHIVKTKPSEDGGEIVSVWHREGTVKGRAACSLRSGPYFTVDDRDNNSFYGISAVYFFIDQGTSSGSRSLAVYKTDSGDEVTNVGYYGNGNPPRIEAARYLFYDDISNKKGPASACPQAAKWRKQGGGVVWLQGKKMDLDEQTISNVGPLRCAYQE
ncbi:MAG TPA: hypothetical protein VL501_02440, partial [Pyrinomonadaceae bacterium]|nr:hypothetical protein [Pyrinomonadaceae bacterium]